MALHPLIQQTHLPFASCFLDHHPNLSLSCSSRPISRDKLRSRKGLILEGIEAIKMSRRNDNGAVKLDLKLNLSPARSDWPESPTRSSPMTVSPTNSCVSLELVQDDNMELRYSSSPETTTSMMLAGCPRCLMYVMLSEDYPKCPKCKSSVLLDVVFDKPLIKKSKT